MDMWKSRLPFMRVDEYRTSLWRCCSGVSAVVPEETTCWRLPAPQGPFWSDKTDACSPGGAVAPYKDDGTERSILSRQEVSGWERGAIGIDPDSKGFVCALVKIAQPAVVTKSFMTQDSDLKSFLSWVKAQGDVIVAIEGSHGLSRPLEKALREAAVIFYSFKPADTEKFRKAVLGQNKDERKDAESVARYALALEAQGRLERYRRVWFADAELQLLSRCYERKTQESTAEVNRLWKLLR